VRLPARRGPGMSTLVPAQAGRSAIDLDVRAAPLSGGGALVRDYLAGKSEIGRFFAGHPSDPDAYLGKAGEVDARLDAAARRRAGGAIRPLGDAAGRLEKILAGDGFFVTTGQQPGLFGGPLYTLYKALAAIRLAAVLEGVLGRPVLGLFWVGSDDHDWAEASHSAILDGEGYVQRVSVPAPVEATPLPMSRRTWGRGIDSAVADVVAGLPRTPSGDAVRAHLREAYTADTTVAASFVATLRLLLHDQRIAIVDSADPRVRGAAAPVLRAEAEHTSAHHEQLRRQTERLAEAGYPAQVAVVAGTSNLMMEDEHGRDRLVRGRHGWLTRRERTAMTDEALFRLLDREPERFSANVLLRPVVENAIFPTIAYVAGPGEVRYYAQLGCLFRAHGIRPPVVVPRPSVTLIEPAIRRILDEIGMHARAFARPFDELFTEAARERAPTSLGVSVRRVREDMKAAFAALEEAAVRIDPTLQGPVRAARNQSLREADRAERRILRQLKRQHGVLGMRLRRAAASLHPGGTPQERVFGALPFLARYGPGLVPAIAAALDLQPDGSAAWDESACEE
jgi:bacillithiol synthase